MDEDVNIKRKRLIFRSWHRGTREIDLMLGGFADAHLLQFGAAQLELYDRFLSNSDPDIFNWMAGQEPLPPAEDNEVVSLMMKFFKTAS
jgi:antitoxin CptB